MPIDLFVCAKMSLFVILSFLFITNSLLNHTKLLSQSALLLAYRCEQKAVFVTGALSSTRRSVYKSAITVDTFLAIVNLIKKLL